MPTALITGITGQDGSYLGRAAAREGLHGPRADPAGQYVPYGANRASLSGSARP